jgi:glycosyltransferase involved in cell wall biosynthesis
VSIAKCRVIGKVVGTGSPSIGGHASATAMRKRPHFLIFGRIYPFEQLEGGRIRMQYVTGAFDRLGIGVTRIHPVVSVRWPAFFLGLVFTKLGWLLANPFRRVYVVGSGTPPSVGILRLLRRRCAPLFFDVQDDPRIQFPDLGIKERRKGELEESGRNLDSTISTFRLLGFPSEEFASRYQVEGIRKVMTPNASDPSYIPATPLPDAPIVGLVGGATHGRGADLLIEACALVREQVPELSLRLALGNVSGRGYLSELIDEYRETPWIRFESVDYRGVPAFLHEVHTCVVPHRHSRYLDLALPIKLFDYMAAGRPVVVTRCRAMAELVQSDGVGLVSDFTAESLAASLVQLLTDRPLAERLGENGRRMVERRYSWRHTQDNVITAVRRELEAQER